MKGSRLTALFLLTAAVTACHVGPQIDTLRMPLRPHGADIVVERTAPNARSRTEFRGELLEVRDDGLLVAAELNSQAGQAIYLFPWNIIYRAASLESNKIKTRSRSGGQRKSDSFEDFRLVSRFPQGLSSELQRELLNSFNQKEMIIVTPEL